MHHRSGSWVKGHYRNGTWIAGHNRKGTYVSDYTKHFFSNTSAVNKGIVSISEENYSSSGKIVNISHLDQEYNFLKKFFRLESTPFSKDIRYKDIDNKIKKVIFTHFSELMAKKLENKSNFDFISYLEKYIIDNIESELLEIKDIENFYTKLKDILQIVYIFILCEIDPYYKIIYVSYNKDKEVIFNNLEEIMKIMKDTIQENKAILSKYYNQSDWEYQRNKFFNQEVKSRIFNPKIALHILFKKVCDENLNKGEVIILSKEEVVQIMKNIIHENKVILSRYYNQSDWEYQRNKFFNLNVKNKIYNPKLALHMLFNKVCDDNLN